MGRGAGKGTASAQSPGFLAHCVGRAGDSEVSGITALCVLGMGGLGGGTVPGLIGYSEDFAFYSEWDGKPFEDLSKER